MDQQMSDTPPPAEPPLLSYALTSLPAPLQVSSPGWLTLTVANSTGAPVTCTHIVVTIPRGTNADDLIAATNIDVTPATGWTFLKDGGMITFTAPGGSVEVKGGGLTFVFAVTINDQTGPATVTLDETASSATKPAQRRSTSWPMVKDPISFTLSPLMAVPIDDIDIVYGSPAQITWLATGAGVTCTLDYQPAEDGPLVSKSVPPAPEGGSYTTELLTRTGAVTFTLNAQMPAVGQDPPQTLTSQLTVSVETLSLSLIVQPPTIGVGGLAQVQWNSPNASHCLADDGQVLPANGTAYVILQQTHLFTVTAVGPNGQTAQQQKTITVVPTIVPTEAGYSITGTPGQPGAAGAAATVTQHMLAPPYPGPFDSTQIALDGTTASVQKDGDGSLIVTMNGVTRAVVPADTATFLQAVTGATGAIGGDAVLTQTLPPLDFSGQPMRVIPITVIGGTGGQGGAGGHVIWGTYDLQFGNGGPGGQGGNAHIEIDTDPTQGYAQYIVTFAGGAGGAGGSSSLGTGGGQGAPGLAAMAFDGVIVPPDGALAPPRAFAPLALTVTVEPTIVPPNGLALLSWDSPNADRCVLPDGSVVAPSGTRYIVAGKTQQVSVTASDDFGRTLEGSATITVDASIKPTEPATSKTGKPGGPGAAGTNGIVTLNYQQGPFTPTPSSPGIIGGTGDDATVALTVPPLDVSGASTQVIPIAATGGAGGTGGVGGSLTITNPPTGIPGIVQFPQVSSPGGLGGPGGNATVTLTVDPSKPPALFIVEVIPGAGGSGGKDGWACNPDGTGGPTNAPAGAPGAASLTIDGQAALLL